MEVHSGRHRLLGTVAVGVLLTLAACGESNNNSTGATTTPTPLETQQGAVNGGILNVGLVQEPTSFLAAGITDSMTFSYAVDAVTSEGLLWYRSTDETANAKTQADFWRPALAPQVPPIAVLSTTGWDHVSSCDASNPNQAVVNFSTTYGPYLSLGSGVYGILPAKMLQTAFAANGGAGGDLEKVAQTVDLTVGSGNTNAFKGTDTLDKIVLGTGPYVLSN